MDKLIVVNTKKDKDNIEILTYQNIKEIDFNTINPIIFISFLGDWHLNDIIGYIKEINIINKFDRTYLNHKKLSVILEYNSIVGRPTKSCSG